MRTRLLLAAFCILILPFVFSPAPGDKLRSTAPFATVAFAGHTVSGNWCDCGAPGCICDPGENPHVNRARAVTDNQASDQLPSAIGAHSRAGFDVGTGVLILALALLVWARLRA